MSFSDGKHAEIIFAFHSTPRYVVYNLDIDNLYFESIFNQIYTPELQLKKS